MIYRTRPNPASSAQPVPGLADAQGSDHLAPGRQALGNVPQRLR